MRTKASIFDWFKALLCLVFFVGLVLFPPAASHAASATHSAHAISGHAGDNPHAMHSHHAPSPEGIALEDAPDVGGSGDQSSGKCCSGICLAVALHEDVAILSERVSSNTFLLEHHRAGSTELTGAIRPPRNLI